MKVEDGEGTLVSMAGQGGNRGGAQSRACRVAAKPTVMLATGTGCCGPQVVLVCTSKGQAANMKTQLIPPTPSFPSFASPAVLFFPPALRLFFRLLSPREAHPRCCRIFELRRRHAVPAGLPRQSAAKTQEERANGLKWRGGQGSERHNPSYCVTGR